MSDVISSLESYESQQQEMLEPVVSNMEQEMLEPTVSNVEQGMLEPVASNMEQGMLEPVVSNMEQETTDSALNSELVYGGIGVESQLVGSTDIFMQAEESTIAVEPESSNDDILKSFMEPEANINSGDIFGMNDMSAIRVEQPVDNADSTDSIETWKL